MTRKQILPVLLVLIFALPTLAQDAKQEINDRLWEAVRKGDAAAVKALLDGGADVNAKFRYGTTALFKAAEKGHTEVVKVLLERGADVKVKDTFYGATAMTWALDHKHVEIVRLLLEKNMEDAGDVLMTGTREGHAELVRIALAAKDGLKPDALNAALSAATSDDKKAEIAEMLRKAGAVPPPEVDAATLQSYVGKYRGEPGREIIVTFKDGKLFAATTGQSPFALMAVDKTTFRPTAFDGLTVTFNVEGGKVTGFALKQGQNTMQLKKVE